MFWNRALWTHFVKRTSWKLEIGPEGDGRWGGDVVIDDSCDLGWARKTTRPKVTALIYIGGMRLTLSPPSCCIHDIPSSRELEK